MAMRIINRTAWDTVSLRRVFSKVLSAWNGRHKDMPRRQVKHLRVTVVHCRRWSGNNAFSGCAYYNSGYMTIRIPNPRPRESYGAKVSAWEGELDVLNLAFLFEHELAHCAGYHHKSMGHLNKWDTAHTGRYDYVKHLKVPRAKEVVSVPKPKPDVQVIRYKAAMAGLKRWQTKAKWADTALKKYRAKVRYYEGELEAKGKLAALKPQ